MSEWTVLPHDKIEKLAENLWRVEGTLPTISLKRVMVVVRLADGRLVVHSPISMDEASMKELDGWGKVAFIIVPNGFHRLDAPAWKARYPEARVLAPAGSRKKIEEKVAVDGTVDEVTDGSVRVVSLAGIKEMEVALVVDSKDGASLVFTDAVFNMPMPRKFVDRMIVKAMGSAPGPRVSRIFKLFAVKDKAAFRADLEKLAQTPRLTRLIVAHKDVAHGADAKAALEKAAGFV